MKRPARMGRSRKRAADPAFGSCTEEERAQILNDFGALRTDRMRTFLTDQGVLGSGAKEIMARRLEKALGDGDISLAAIIEFLDHEASWGKQHVFLLGPPLASDDTNPVRWADPGWMRTRLIAHRVSNRLGKHLPFVLPEKLSLAAIAASKETVRITAIQRREGWERVEELDKHQSDSSGAEIEMRAFRRVITRGLVSFEWDLRSNVAVVQISQLPAHHRYEEIFKEFRILTRGWLPVDMFPIVSLGKAIGVLYSEAKAASPRLRAHGVEFEATDGRRLTGRSKQARQPLDGNQIIDTALDSLQAAKSTGQQGNFFFATKVSTDVESDDEDLWTEDAHVVLMGGSKNRINFATPQREETVRDVLQRIRAAC